MQQRYSVGQEREYGSDGLYQQQETQQGAQSIASNSGPTAGQRLGLAIASLVALVLACVAVMGFLTNGGRNMLGWPGLILACVLIVTLSAAITAINFIFNYRQH
ncbi:MAG TPA: hypothetical protein VGN34_29330 [Ktedonobacteraceae bacterium]